MELLETRSNFKFFVGFRSGFMGPTAGQTNGQLIIHSVTRPCNTMFTRPLHFAAAGLTKMHSDGILNGPMRRALDDCQGRKQRKFRRSYAESVGTGNRAQLSPSPAQVVWKISWALPAGSGAECRPQTPFGHFLRLQNASGE